MLLYKCTSSYNTTGLYLINDSNLLGTGEDVKVPLPQTSKSVKVKGKKILVNIKNFKCLFSENNKLQKRIRRVPVPYVYPFLNVVCVYIYPQTYLYICMSMKHMHTYTYTYIQIHTETHNIYICLYISHIFAKFRII